MRAFSVIYTVRTLMRYLQSEDSEGMGMPEADGIGIMVSVVLAGIVFVVLAGMVSVV
jgi:hypothetical protein